MADDNEKWISARDAVKLLKPVTGGEYSAQMTICERANDGLIRSRAGRFIYDTQRKDDFELPEWFWWARGGAALTANWNTGYFETTHHRFRYDSVNCRAYDVQFLRADIMKMVLASSAVEQPNAQTTKPPGEKIFVGHGRSLVWHELRNFIEKSLNLPCDEFNAVLRQEYPFPYVLNKCWTTQLLRFSF
jgi:hypothetical protein